ncbi:TetR family transcriptional regulator [Streptomyces virens]|uniref:DNA-binding transcriptional regulator YbjK n=2 Tax=Streptomyces TaxID=1883 RepID=A0AA40VHK5_9ACTN|nr:MULTISPECIES: TetR family transcriptional regulator [Streptomyces]MBA8944060.1 DNA-binding transcriptional regulator YbjK [Streptomyces calvus]MBA8978129.1 DNA-binding transcriptional regulator YbjK [Streptomyces calvus]MYS29894.1 TetR family transcriptional regulator [Streptomyces sp. SID7804]GGP57994.1 TetR family transcriptional regulator [Streptomyces calvus]
MATGHTDPHRRARILAATLDLIVEEGVAGVSHRKIAARAQVPLGSMTYHFSGIDDLLREAFTGHADHFVALFEQHLGEASTADEAREAVTDLIHTLSEGPGRDLVLTQELYTLAARHEPYRVLCRTWMRRSRELLEQHFSARTARQLDALIEGLTLHRALDDAPPDRELTREAVARITGAVP